MRSALLVKSEVRQGYFAEGHSLLAAQEFYRHPWSIGRDRTTNQTLRPTCGARFAPRKKPHDPRDNLTQTCEHSAEADEMRLISLCGSLELL
jgi:hypothetical protein